MRRKSIFFKAISLLLVLSFSFCNVSFAAVEGSALAPAPEETKKELTVDDIGIAIDAGMVKSKYQGGSGKIVVHIQDAHCNYEAQSNINKILDQLAKEDGVSIISVEGAEGIVDTTWFKAFPDEEIRREVADYFMKKGEITGAEFFSINSDYNGTIFGAENREYYVKNLKAFTEVYPYKSVIENYFLNLRTVANRLKSSIYPAKLKELDLKIRAFDNKEMELSDFVSYLYKSSQKYRVPVDKYENFKKLIDTLEYEKKIDFDIVDQERNNYIDSLSEKLSKEKMAELVGQSIRFKKGHIKAVDFYSHLRELAKEYNIPIVQEFPNLFYYYLYTKLYDTIDNEGLFREINVVQENLKDKLFTDDVQRKLDRYSQAIDLHIDLVNIELTNDDYDIFKEQFEDFSLNDVVAFLGGLSNRYGLSYSMGEVPVQVSENLPNMVDFYEVAMKRDNVLVENTLSQMKKEDKNICVMIAGGFHTKGIKDILEKKDISYIVVTPKITKDIETPYIKVLTNQRTSLEDIITESAAMPGMGAVRGKVAEPEGGTLSPLLRAAYLTNLYLKDPEELKELSDQIGKVGPGMSAEEAAKVFTADVVNRFITGRSEDGQPVGWLSRVEANIKARPEGAKEWADFIQEDEKWRLLLSVYIGLMSEAGIKWYVPNETLLALLVLVARDFRETRRAQMVAPPAIEEAAKIDRYTAQFGLVPLVDFGQELPLAREMNPQGLLMPQVSNTDKNLIVTEVITEGIVNPRAMVGLNPVLVKEYGRDFMRHYQVAMAAYIESLNAVYLALREEMSDEEMAAYRDVIEAAEEVEMNRVPSQISKLPEALNEFRQTAGEIDKFYNYVEVIKPGQIISIPANTLFAVPAGVKAIETYRPGEEVLSIPDLSLKPIENVEYKVLELYKSIQRILHTLRTETPAPAAGLPTPVTGFPEAEITERGPVVIESLPEGLERRGTGLQVMTFTEDAELDFPSERVAKERNYIVISGKASIEIGAETYEIAVSPAGARGITIPANVEKGYTIRAEKGARIVETSAPIFEETFEAPLDTGREIPGTGRHEFTRDIVYTYSPDLKLHDTYERLTVVTRAYPYRGPSERQYSMMVQRGRIRVERKGEEPLILESGEIFVPPVYSPELEIVNLGAEPAVIKVDYKNTIADDVFFTDVDILRKHINEIKQQGKVNVVMPSEMFRDGGIDDPGSRDWWQKLFRTYINPEMTIVPYWSEERQGVEVTGLDASVKVLEGLSSEENNILIATKSKIEGASRENQEFMKSFRVIGIPDIDMEEIDGEHNPLKEGARNMGWFGTRATIGSALLLTIVTPEKVFFDEGVDSPAYDMQRFMGLVLGREVSRGDICYLLPQEEIARELPKAIERWKLEGAEIPAWIRDVEKALMNLKAWFLSLVEKALLAMPIRPFDTDEDILKRHENMFKAVKAV